MPQKDNTDRVQLRISNEIMKRITKTQGYLMLVTGRSYKPEEAIDEALKMIEFEIPQEIRNKVNEAVARAEKGEPVLLYLTNKNGEKRNPIEVRARQPVGSQ